MNPNLIAAAQQGRTDLLYAEIECHPYVLDDIDKIPFVETPLHLAASVGQASFAIEIMRLKPSFAQKLNPQGLSPMHLALQNRRYSMVYRFTSINANLVRIQGKDDITPLHMVCQAGEINLLENFLSVCPKSILDVTLQNQNALHIAVKSRQFRVLHFLVRWLQCNCDTDAGHLQYSTLNCWDEAGNNVLHMLVALDDPDPEIVKLLLRCNIYLNAVNFNNSTALDILERHNQGLNNNIKDILVSAGARRAASVAYPTSEDSLSKHIAFLEDYAIKWFRCRANIDDSNRTVLLGAVVLVVTITFQASLSSPGGVFQVDSQNGSQIHNSTETGIKKYAGKSVNSGAFTVFWLYNTTALLLSVIAIFLLLPNGRPIVTMLVLAPFVYFGFIYFISMSVISPKSEIVTVNWIMCLIGVLVIFAHSVCLVPFRRLRRSFRKK